MARLPFRTFALYNALGGTLWAIACVYGGYLVGDVIGSYLSNIGYLLIGLVVVALALHLLKRRRESRKSPESATSDLSVH
jgi:membrane-associated protein